MKHESVSHQDATKLWSSSAAKWTTEGQLRHEYNTVWRQPSPSASSSITFCSSYKYINTRQSTWNIKNRPTERRSTQTWLSTQKNNTKIANNWVFLGSRTKVEHLPNLDDRQWHRIKTGAAGSYRRRIDRITKNKKVKERITVRDKNGNLCQIYPNVLASIAHNKNKRSQWKFVTFSLSRQDGRDIS